jgi:hypothetical protein
MIGVIWCSCPERFDDVECGCEHLVDLSLAFVVVKSLQQRDLAVLTGPHELSEYMVLCL